MLEPSWIPSSLNSISQKSQNPTAASRPYLSKLSQGCLFLAFYPQAYFACSSRDCSQFVTGWSTSLCPIRLHEQRTRCLLKLVYPGPNSTLSLGFSLWVLSGSCDLISKFVDCLVPVWDTIIKRTVALCISETYCVKGPMG